MLLLAATLLTLPTPAVAVPDALRGALRPGSADCPRTTSYYAWLNRNPPRPHKLTELPAANVYLAVYRHIGRCEAPVIVRYGVGSR
jgi:hypothetical protein